MKQFQQKRVVSQKSVSRAIRAAASLAAVAIGARWGLGPDTAYAETDITSGTTFNVAGPTLVDNDRIFINSDGGNAPTILFFGTNSTSVSGTGAIQLQVFGNNPITSQLNGATNITVTFGSGILTHGAGEINAFVINNGTISADVGSAWGLVLQAPSMTNNATMLTSGNSHLDLNGVNLTQGALGTINAGSGGLVQIYNGATINGGSLAGLGAFQVSGTSAATFNSVSSSGSVLVVAGGQLNFTGAGFTNAGTLNINNFNNAATIAQVNTSMTFSGTGSVSLQPYNNNSVNAQLNTLGNAVLTISPSMLVHGAGQINARLINNGTISADTGSAWDLYLQTQPMTNNATLQAVGNSHLNINGINVTQGPAGTINGGPGSLVQIYNGAAIIGGSLTGAGSFQTSGPAAPTFTGVSNAASVLIVNGSQLNFTGSGFTNTGTLNINNQNNATSTAQVNNSMTWSGAGSVYLLPYNNNNTEAQLNTSGTSVLTIAPSLLVHGAGQINSQLINNGTISADVGSAWDLVLQTLPVTNNANLQTIGNSHLDIGGITLTQSAAGAINAGLSGQVQIYNGATISGGSLNGLGSFQTSGPAAPTFNLVTNNASVLITGGTQLNFTGGSFTNNGTLNINNFNNATTVAQISNSMTWGGTGTTFLEAYANISSNAQLNSSPGAVLTIAPSLLVHGAGQINAAVVNNGTISADYSSAWSLGLQTSSMTNNATMSAANGAYLDINGITVNQGSNGVIFADNGSLVRLTGGDTISGGTLRSGTSSGAIQSFGGTATSNTLNNVVSFAQINLLGGNNLNFTGSGFTNNAQLLVDADTNNAPAIVTVKNSMTFSGTGSVYLNDYGNVPSIAQLNVSNGATLTIAPTMLVHGLGQINGQVVNNGTISADYSGSYILSLNGGPMTNNATISAANGAFMDLNAITLNQGSNGVVLAGNGSLVRLTGGTTINGGTLRSGTSSGIIQSFGGTATSNTLNSVINFAQLNLLGGNNLNFTGLGFTNNAQLLINSEGNNITIASVNNSMTFSGTGSVYLNDYGNVQPTAQLNVSNGATLTIAPTMLVHGLGQVTGQVVNNGTISADYGGTYVLSLNGGPMTNNATISAANGAFMDLNAITLNQGSNGVVLAGNGSLVRLTGGTTISGGTLKNGTASGAIQSIGGTATSNTLNSVSSFAQVNLLGGNNLNFTGLGFTNNAQLLINSDSNNIPAIASVKNSMTFSGTGSVYLNDYGNVQPTAQLNVSNGATLTIAPTMLVHGLGQITGQVVNNGTISADYAGTYILSLNGGPMTNNATISAANGAFMDLNAITLNQGTNGQLVANNSSYVRLTGGTTINGGTLRSGTSSGIIQSFGGTATSNTLNNVVSFAQVNLPGGNNLNITGPGFTNNAQLLINSDGNNIPAIASVNNSMTFSGTGSVYLNDYGNVQPTAQLNVSNGATLTIAPTMLVHGLGQVTGQIVNNGTISADYSGTYILSLNGAPMTNNATISTANGAYLNINGVSLTQSSNGNITAGASSLVQVYNASTLNGGSLTGPGVFQFSGTAATTLINPNSTTTLQELSGSVMSFSGNGFTNNGSFTVNSDNNAIVTTATVNSGFNWSGAGSVTINNRGTLTIGSTNGLSLPFTDTGSLNVASGGTFALAPYPASYNGTVRVVHSINNLIAPNSGTVYPTGGKNFSLMAGHLDINNHSLLISNINGVPSSGSSVQALVVQGYNGSPNDPVTHAPYNQAGFSYSSGPSGIISTTVNTDASSSAVNNVFGGNGSPKAYAIGVADTGDNGYINWQSSPVGDGTIPAGKTLVAMTVMGDINMDGTVDINDFNIWQAAYVYQGVNDPNFSHKPDHWAMGDITQDGVVDINDFNYWQVAYTHVSIAPPPPGYQAAVASAQSRTNARRAALASATLTGSSAAASSSASPAAVSGNVVPANNVELDVDLKTGDVVLNSGGVSVKNFVITSTGGQLMPGQSTGATSFTIWNTVSAANPSLGGQILSAQPGNLTEAMNSNTPFVMSNTQAFDYGLIFPVNGAQDLQFTYTKANALKTTTGVIVYLNGSGVPEPTMLSLLGLGAMGLMARRRKAKKA